MLKKYNKSLFFIPPEIVFHLDSKLLNFFFFGISGWCLQEQFNSFPYLYKEAIRLVRSFFLSTFLLNNLIFGLIKNYFKYFQLRGRSFKYSISFGNLVIKLGFSHKLYYIVPYNTCITLITKQIFKISNRSLHSLKRVFFDLHCIRKFDNYKGKGLLYYKSPLILKASSKKTKV